MHRFALIFACSLACSCTLDSSALEPLVDSGVVPTQDGGGQSDSSTPPRDAGVDAFVGDDGGEPLTMIAVAAGGSSTCALRSDGAVFCWGLNDHGQLGDGTTTSGANPRRVELASGAASIAVGGAHACAVLVDGRLFCWGNNAEGQVAGDASNEESPVHVTDGVGAVAAGENHTCFIATSGDVSCFGRNDNDQLGFEGVDQSAPRALDPALAASALALGTNHSCAIVSGGVQCWGDNNNGRLGDGTNMDRASPTPIASVASEGVFSAVGAGNTHSCAVQGSITYCWGQGNDGRLGYGDTAESRAPVAVSSLDDAVAVDLGLDHTCALRASGRVSCWGKNDLAQLGMEATGDSISDVPMDVGIADAVSLGVGHNHACVVSTGRVLCWGADNNSQLGEGATGVDPLSIPVVVPDLP